MPLDEIRARANEGKPDSLVGVSIAELRELAESNQNHPSAKDYLKSSSLRKREDTYTVFVDREDILGILENKEVVATRVFEEDENGIKVPVIRKKLGNTVKPPEADTPESPSRKKEPPVNP